MQAEGADAKCESGRVAGEQAGKESQEAERYTTSSPSCLQTEPKALLV